MRAILIIASALTCVPTCGYGQLLIPVNGQLQNANLLALDGRGRFEFAIGEGKRVVAANQLVRWGSPAEKRSHPQILMANGCLLVADPQFMAINISNDQIRFDSLAAGEVQIPLKWLKGIIFQPPEENARYDQLNDRIQTAKGSADVVILENSDELKGTITECADDVLQLKTADGLVPIRTVRIRAVVFNPALFEEINDEGLRVQFGFKDGSRISATRWKVGETGIGIPFGNGNDVILVVLPKYIVYLQTFGAGITYLSDLKPQAYHHRRYLNLSWPYHEDRNVMEGRLRCGGQLYPKGIGMHSVSILTYQLDGAPERLQAEIGIDDSTEGGGSVVFKVYVDNGSGKWQSKFESDVIRGGTTPVPIAVDIRGARRLGLIVNQADRGTMLDRANWLTARLVP